MNASNFAVTPEVAELLSRMNRVLGQLEAYLPPAPPPTNWNAPAFRWRKRGA